VVLRWKGIRLRLAAAADFLRVLLTLMHVMRKRSEVVEELAEQVPSALALHHSRSDEQIAGGFDGLFQQKSSAMSEPHVSETFVCGRPGSVVRVGRGREPSLVDAAAMPAKRIQVVGMQLESPSGQHEGTGYPRR